MAKYSVADLREEYNWVMSLHEANDRYFPCAYESLRAAQNLYKKSVFFDLGEDEHRALVQAYYAWQSPFAGGGWGNHARGKALPDCNEFCEMCR